MRLIITSLLIGLALASNTSLRSARLDPNESKAPVNDQFSDEEYSDVVSGSQEGEVDILEPPRLSGGLDVATLAAMVLPDPRDVVTKCVFKYPPGKFNRPPSKAPNKDYHFFFDLEDTIYTVHDVKVRKYRFLDNFLREKMKVTDDKQIKYYLSKNEGRKKLKQFLEVKKVEINEPYDFIKPDKTVTSIISAMRANKWIFTKSSLYMRPY